MPKIRAGVISNDFFPILGGMGRVVHEVYVKRLMKEPDLELHFFSPCDNGIPNHTRAAGFCRKFGLNLTFSLAVNKNIAAWIRDKKLDLLSIHGGTGGVFLFLKPSVPVIYTCHGTLYRQYRSALGQRWKWALSKLEQASYQRAALVTAVSEDVRDIILTRYGIPAAKVQVIYNGVDTSEFRRLDRVNRIKNSLLFAGRLAPSKGISYLVKEVIPAVRNTIPDVKLFVAGAGGLRKELEDYTISHGLEPNIHFLGWVGGEDLVRWYNRVELAVLPSARESFGLMIIEAMACGAPVIATRIPAVTEIVKDGENGLLVDYGDSGELSRTITEALSNRALRAELSRAGRRTVEGRFSWDRIAGQMKAVLLSQVLN
ncbi:MAG: glycosyltransferase family 4 protein [Chloroflexi bacterium]|nr:glycosyltransferase family 4 protein [Chloroflexota bacterium]